MIIGIGVDLVDIRRIERLLNRFGDRFIKKIFTPGEQTYASSARSPLSAYANRFAAKEAAAKALGTGMGKGIGWKTIEISRTPTGAPTLIFHGKAYDTLMSSLPPTYKANLHISFSDEYPYSTAFVVISAVG